MTDHERLGDNARLREILTSQSIDPNRIGFARWLREHGRLNEGEDFEPYETPSGSELIEQLALLTGCTTPAFYESSQGLESVPVAPELITLNSLIMRIENRVCKLNGKSLTESLNETLSVEVDPHDGLYDSITCFEYPDFRTGPKSRVVGVTTYSAGPSFYFDLVELQVFEENLIITRGRFLREERLTQSITEAFSLVSGCPLNTRQHDLVGIAIDLSHKLLTVL